MTHSVLSKIIRLVLKWVALTIMCGFLTVSCKGPLDKPITEKLSLDHLKTSIKEDTLFESTYRYIQNVKDSILKTDIDKAKWSDLTYQQIQDFVKLSNDTAFLNPLIKKFQNEWQSKYGSYKAKVDSISRYWKQYKTEHSIQQYVDLQLVKIDKEYYSYGGDIRHVNLGFRISPLKGKIDQLRFYYRIEAKLNENNENTYGSILDRLGRKACITTTPFSKPVIRYWEVRYSDEKLLKNKTLESFLRDYNIYIEIDEIRKDGINMSDDDLGIPQAVEFHWKYENDDQESLRDLFVGQVVKDILNQEYMGPAEYSLYGIRKSLKAKDSLCYEFMRLAPQNVARIID